MKEYYRSGKLKSETPFVGGWEIGTSKSFYEDGKLMN